MAHIFHVVELDPMFHMLLARPWIHDLRCVPSSWHQYIKAAPMNGNQVRVRGLKNPFMLEEAHFLEAGFFMAGNVIKMARQEQTTHSYPAVVDLPAGVQPTSNFFPVLPPKILKSHKSPIVSTPPSSSTTEGVLVPLRVNLHDGRPTKAPAIAIATIEAEKDKIVLEDAAMDAAQIPWPSISFDRKVLTLERQKKSSYLNVVLKFHQRRLL